VFLACVAWLPASTLAFAGCTAPASINARLRAHPASETYSSLGSWFGDKKQFRCAANAFASAARLEPQSASLAYLWGLSLYSAGDAASSLPPLHHAAELDPSDIRPHLALGAALDRLKRTIDAEAEWRKALAIDSNSATALDSLSQNLLDRNDFASVVALLDKPANGSERSPLQSLNLGIALASTAKLDDAARVLREGLNTDPDSLPIADELAVVLMLLSRDEEADAVFSLALTKHPGDQPTQLLYLRTLVSSHSEKAPQYAHQLLAAYRNNWEVQYLNGLLASREGDFQRARTHLERSVALNPRYAQAHTALGGALAKLGDLHGAKAQLEKGLALGDNQPEVQYSLAQVLRSLGESASARERLQIYQQLKDAQSGKTQAAGKAESGDQAIAGGNPAQAAALYREALASDPNEPLLHYKLAKALEKLNDVAGETNELERAIQLDPKLAEAQNQRGYVAARSGDSTHAEAFFRAASQASPSYVVAWVNLAATLASEAKWHEARKALDRALEIDPDNVEARRLGEAVAAAHHGP
jgi:tetratricopeptide (TPR) repeat protein